MADAIARAAAQVTLEARMKLMHDRFNNLFQEDDTFDGA
jgi:hypothetical protein